MIITQESYNGVTPCTEIEKVIAPYTQLVKRIYKSMWKQLGLNLALAIGMYWMAVGEPRIWQGTFLQPCYLHLVVLCFVVFALFKALVHWSCLCFCRSKLRMLHVQMAGTLSQGEYRSFVRGVLWKIGILRWAYPLVVLFQIALIVNYYRMALEICNHS